MTRPAAVLFDLDGVLTVNNVFHRQAWRELAYSHLHLTLSEHELDTKVDGGRNNEILERLTGRPPTPDELSVFHTAKESRYRELAAGQLVATTGLREYLAGLRELGIPAVIVTSGDRTNTAFALSALGLEDAFAGRIMGEDVTRGKPDPEPYRRGAALLGLDATQCLAHEDAVNGVKSAASAGCRVVALTTTLDAAPLLAAGAERAEADFLGWTAWLDGS